MRVAATRATVAVAATTLRSGHAGRAKQDCGCANQVKYFHRPSPKSTILYRLQATKLLPDSRHRRADNASNVID
jgi:hypothetical protein